VLRTYDIVTVKETFDDAEIRGKRGYIIGKVEGKEIAVFIYDIERVWCLHADDVIATGEYDYEAEDDRAHAIAIRVDSKGEIIG
jgi:hypothetical protein